MSDLICPFCKESDFDGHGLKFHLLAGHCLPFNSINLWANPDSPEGIAK
jgi:hypothetical protein